MSHSVLSLHLPMKRVISYLDNVAVRIRVLETLLPRTRIDLKQAAVFDDEIHVALNLGPHTLVVQGRLVFGKDAHQIKVTHDLGLDALEHGPLLVKVGRKQVDIATVGFQGFFVEFLAKVNGSGADVMEGSDDVVDLVAQLRHMVCIAGVNKLDFSANQQGDLVLVLDLELTGMSEEVAVLLGQTVAVAVGFEFFGVEFGGGIARHMLAQAIGLEALAHRLFHHVFQQAIPVVAVLPRMAVVRKRHLPFLNKRERWK